MNGDAVGPLSSHLTASVADEMNREPDREDTHAAAPT